MYLSTTGTSARELQDPTTVPRGAPRGRTVGMTLVLVKGATEPGRHHVSRNCPRTNIITLSN